MKTYHEGAKDAEFEYNEVQRLAPRNELCRKLDPRKARIGQTLRFVYEQSSYKTVVVCQTLSKSLKCKTECGRGRGKMQVFEINEIDECMELFCSSLLQDLLTQVKNSSQSNANKSKTKQIPTTAPELHAEFRVPEQEKYKRKFHVLQILGKGSKLLCERTNARARRKLTNKKRWRDMKDGPIFQSFLGAFIGVAMLKVGSRHLMKKTPKQISQIGEGGLFEKLPTDLFRL